MCKVGQINRRPDSLCVYHPFALQIATVCNRKKKDSHPQTLASANAHVSMDMDQCLIHLWILIFAECANAYASAHMDSKHLNVLCLQSKARPAGVQLKTAAKF